MDVTTITSLVGSLGFPIAACCFLGWYMTSIMKEFRDTMEKNTLAIRELTLMVSQKWEEGDGL